MCPITALLGGIIPLCLRKGHLIEFAAGRIGVMSAIGPNIAPRRLCEAKVLAPFVRSQAAPRPRLLAPITADSLTDSTRETEGGEGVAY
jgi:hypothetical protein